MLKNLPENWQYSLAGFALAQVLALLGLAAAVNKEMSNWLLVAASILGVGGLGLFFAALARSLKLIRGSLLALGRRRLTVGVHTSKWATSDDEVLRAHRFLSALIPEDPPSKALMLAVFAQNPSSILLIESKQSGISNLVGVSMLVPLTMQAVREIESLSLVDETHARIGRHVCRTWRKPAGIYIGAVGGSSPRGKAWALSLTEAIIADSGVVRVYARPATAEGRRVMRSVGFEKLPEPSIYWRVQTVE